MEVSGKLYVWADFFSGERHSNSDWVGGWLDLRDGFDVLESKLRVPCEIFGFPSGLTEDLSLLGRLAVSFGKFFLTFRWILRRLTLKVQVLRFSETSGSVHTRTQRNITHDLNLRKQMLF
jgi:hypothetical protein